MDFAYSETSRALQARVSAFMDQYVYPGEVAAPSMACRVIDWAIQAHGGAGVTDEFLVHAYAGARTLRIADGPDEVHRNHIGKLELRRYR